MMKLLQLEWLKIKSARYFFIILGIYLLIATLFPMYLGSMKSVLAFPKVWELVPFWSTFFNVLLGLIVIISVTREFQYKTYRQHIIDGLGREEFFASKLITMVTLALLLSVFISLLILILGYVSTDEPQNVFNGFINIWFYFIHILGYMSIAMFASVLIRSTGITIAIYFIYIFLLEQMIRVLIYNGKDKAAHIVDIFPKGVFANVIPTPALAQVAEGSFFRTNPLPQQQLVLIGCFYILLFWVATYLILRKRDIQ